MNFKLLLFAFILMFGAAVAQRGVKGRVRPTAARPFPPFPARPQTTSVPIIARPPPPPVAIERRKAQVLLRTPGGFEERGGLSVRATA